jgi:cardiolipin synthase (CMP-forming)
VTSSPDPGAAGATAGGGHDPSLDRIATVPNLLSLLRILLIPLFVWLILGEGTEAAGLILLCAVVATDWVDGYIARHTGQVSNLGKVLDPLADRLAIAAGLIAVVIAGAFPLWAALLVLVRDAAVLVVVAVLLVRARIRIDVRWIGKAATLALMAGIPLVSWAGFDLPGAEVTRVAGWILYAVGIVLYYAATWEYAVDIRTALRDRADRSDP